jgi:WD40 repeat protein
MHIDYHQHKGAVVDVLFDSDGKWLYTAGLDGNICQYAVGNDYQPFKMFASYRMPPASPVSRATLCRACSSHLKKRSAPALTSPNSSGSFTSFVTASPASPNSPYPGQLDHDKLPSPGASPDSNNADDSDVSTRAHTCAKYSLDPLYPHCLAVSDDGSLIATLGLDPLTVLLVDTKTMGEVQRVTSTQGPVAKFYFSLARPTTEILLVLRDSSFQRRCLQTGQLVGGSIVRQPKHMLSKHKPSFDLQERPSESQNSECTAAALSPKGRFVVTAKSDGRVQVWEYFSEPDADLGQTSSQTYKLHYDISKRLSSEAGQLTGLNASVSHMCFSRKADRLITVGGDSVFVWSFHGLDNVPSQWEQATDKYGRQRDLDDKDEYAERQRDHFGPSEWHQGGGACRHHLHEPTRHPLHYYGDADSIASSPYPSVYASSDITSSSELDTPNRTSRDIDTPSLLLSPSPVRIEAHSRFFAPTPQNLPPRLEDNANINLHGMDVEDVEDVENVEEEDIGVDEDAIMTLD